jgi:tetratricopeptide (TPR) repeat protein
MAGPSRPGGPPSRTRRLLGEALALLRAGQPAKAGEICDAVLALEPNQPDALHMGGVIALQTGRLDKALERLSRLARLQPRNAGALGDLGLALLTAGRLGDSELTLSRALGLKPAYPEAWLNLGNVMSALGRDPEAAECYGRALKLKPAFPEAHNNLAIVQLRLGRPAVALDGARQALKLRPGMAEGSQTEALALDALGRPDEAIAVAREAIRGRPRAASAWYDLGSIELHYGRLEEAAAHFRQAIALEPGRGEWHRMLSEIVRHKAHNAEIEAMQRAFDDPATRDAERMHFAFGLGKALADIGEHETSFDYIAAGNRLRRQRIDYSPAESDARFADIKAAFTPELFARRAGVGDPDPTPIFVLGMPRSGTSLVEQVIASHPDVHGGGEFTLLNQLVGSLGTGNAPLRFVGLFGRMADPDFAALGAHYVRDLRALSAEARFITDKTPGNFLLIGMIRLILPNATIIHCRRDPVDTCLSIWKTYFGAEGLRYAYDLTEIGHYYRLYADLMEHWRAVLPGFVHDVDYERLIADFDGEAPKILAACGLDWREECGNFFAAGRPVHTASSAQVRQPIYKTSVGQGSRYGARIAPLLEALGPLGSPREIISDDPTRP